MISFPRPSIEQFFKIHHIERFSVSPDEKQIIFSTNLSGKYDLWAMDLTKRFPFRLTFNGQRFQTIHYDKQGRFIIVGFDQDGDECTQLYALPQSGGSLVPIRLAKGKGHLFVALSEDGERIYYTSNKENEKYLSSYCYNMRTETETKILEGEQAATYLEAISPKERSFLFIRYIANTIKYGYIKVGKEEVRITPDNHSPHTVSKGIYCSEDEVYFITNYEADFSYLAKFDLRTRLFTKVLAIEGEELTQLKWDKERKVFYLVTSKGVIDRLYKYDLISGYLESIDLPVHLIEQLVVTEAGNVYLLGCRATRPHNIYRKRQGEDAWEELSHNRVPGVMEEELVDPEILSYPSFDGQSIEALYFPAAPSVSNGYLILWPHGGPQWAERKSFKPLFQLLLNRGYSLFAPNFRGSIGYGLPFMKQVEGDWGHGPRLDLIAGVNWLIEKGKAEKGRIVLMGASYGGYLSLLLAGRHPEYFQACIDLFGISNLLTYIESVVPHWKPVMKKMVGDPEKDREKLIEDSPISYLESMRGPLLVIQGANDPRVVKAESDQLVASLRKRNVDVEYMVLKDEGHGFSKKENEIRVYQSVLQFLGRISRSSVKMN